MHQTLARLMGCLALSVVSSAALAVDAVVYAPVVRVYPIKQTEVYREPREKCYRERVEVPSNTSSTSTVVGGLLGAAIGNKLGHGSSNRKIGTVAGAVLGATVGHGMSEARAHTQVENRDICETVYDESMQERIVGYDVEYRYEGQVYKTRMNRDPGDSIRLRVSAYPEDGY